MTLHTIVTAAALTVSSKTARTALADAQTMLDKSNLPTEVAELNVSLTDAKEALELIEVDFTDTLTKLTAESGSLHVMVVTAKKKGDDDYDQWHAEWREAFNKVAAHHNSRDAAKAKVAELEEALTAKKAELDLLEQNVAATQAVIENIAQTRRQRAAAKEQAKKAQTKARYNAYNTRVQTAEARLQTELDRQNETQNVLDHIDQRATELESDRARLNEVNALQNDGQLPVLHRTLEAATRGFQSCVEQNRFDDAETFDTKAKWARAEIAKREDAVREGDVSKMLAKLQRQAHGLSKKLDKVITDHAWNTYRVLLATRRLADVKNNRRPQWSYSDIVRPDQQPQDKLLAAK